MPDNCIYLLHPQERFLPGIGAWISEYSDFAATEVAWSGWTLQTISYDDANNFSARGVLSRVADRLGPVVLVEKAQTPAKERLRELLRHRSVVVVTYASDATDILAALDCARERFLSGEPFLPRKFVVAVLILRKLERGDYWGGGAKNKAFAYADELAKGRGVDDQFADVSREVANDLYLHDLLVKKPSKSRTKYALNPSRREDVYAAINDCRFSEKLTRILMKDQNEVAARHLD